MKTTRTPLSRHGVVTNYNVALQIQIFIVVF